MTYHDSIHGKQRPPIDFVIIPEQLRPQSAHQSAQSAHHQHQHRESRKCLRSASSSAQHHAMAASQSLPNLLSKQRFCTSSPSRWSGSGCSTPEMMIAMQEERRRQVADVSPTVSSNHSFYSARSSIGDLPSRSSTDRIPQIPRRKNSTIESNCGFHNDTFKSPTASNNNKASTNNSKIYNFSTTGTWIEQCQRPVAPLRTPSLNNKQQKCSSPVSASTTKKNTMSTGSSSTTSSSTTTSSSPTTSTVPRRDTPPSLPSRKNTIEPPMHMILPPLSACCLSPNKTDSMTLVAVAKERHHSPLRNPSPLFRPNKTHTISVVDEVLGILT